jgi:hypothetical protein
MSGSGANLPINIRVTGTQEAEAAFNRVSTTADASMQRVRQSTEQAGNSSRQFGNVIGQAGFQVQDFATQVQMGQNAVTAFGVQFAQFAGLFGTGGAVAGAVVVAGTLAANMLSIGENAAEAERRIQVAFDAIKADSEGVRDVIKEIGDLYKTAADRAQDLARAQALVLSQNVDLRLSNSIQLQDAAATRIPALEREIAVLERRAQVEQDIARRAGRAGSPVPVDQTTDLTSALFVARSQLNGLRAEMDLQDRRIRDLNEARGALGRTGNDLGRGEFGPAAPATIEATRAALDREFVLRRDHAARLDSINVALAQGNTTAAEAVTLRAAAERKLSEDLRALTERQAGATQAVREYEALQLSTAGLLVGNSSDARVAGEINALPPVRQQQALRAASARAEAEVKRDQERVLREQERQNQQVTDSIVRYGADRFADMFAENSRGWAGMLDTFRSTFRSLMARIAAEAIIRPIIAPIVQGLGLGQLGTGGGGFSLGGLFGGGQGATAAQGGGGLSISNLSSGAGLINNLRTIGAPGGMGAFFPGGAAVNTGFGGLDGVLNASLYTPAAGSMTSSGFASGTALAGEAGAFVGGGGAAASGLSVAGSIGPLAAIGGGAYGVYSGLQRGGVGGYTSAAGGAISAATGIGMLGAAAGLLPALGVLGPIGLALGAALAIAGALMPGAKPSSMGQEARIELATGDLTRRGLGGDRYSAGNASQAEAAVQSISDLARNLSAALGGLSLGDQAAAVGVTRSTLYLDAVGQKAQFANNEEGAKQLSDTAARFLINAFTEAEARAVAARGQAGSDQLGLLMNSGGSVETLQQNLEWYNGTFKALTQTAEATNQYAQALASTAAPYEQAIEKARSLGVAEGLLAQRRDEALAKLAAERDAQIGRMDNSLTARWFRAVGLNQNADMLAFDAGAAEEIRTTRESLEQMGLSAEQVAEKITRTEQVLAAERLTIVQRYAEEAAQTERQAAAEAARAAEQAAQARQVGAGGALGAVTSLREYAASLGATNIGANTAMDRFGASQRQFDAIFGAARAGDANSITGLRDAAETFRINAREVFGGGAGYADAVRVISDRIDAIGGLGAEQLTQSFIAENARQNTDRVVDALAELRAENAALRRDINMLMMRPAA